MPTGNALIFLTSVPIAYYAATYGVDPATSSFLVEGTGVDGVTGQYRLEREGRTLDSGELIDLWERWVDLVATHALG